MNNFNNKLQTTNYKLFVFPFAFCLAFLFSSCNLFKHPAKSTTKTINLDKEDFNNNFFTATKERLLGNYENAAKSYIACIKLDPNNAEVSYELARLYNISKQYKEATYYAKRATDLDNKNTWYKILLAEIYTKTSKFKEAAKAYEELTLLQPRKVENYYNMINCLVYAGDINEAIKAGNKFEETFGVTEEISVQKEKLYLQQKKIDLAIKEIEKLIKKFPKETKYMNMLAELYMINKDKDKAFELYNKIIEINPQDVLVHMSLANYYQITGDKEKAFNEIKLAFANQNFAIDEKIKMLLSFYTLSENDTVLKKKGYELLKILTEANPDDAKTYSVYADFLYRDKKLKEAKEQYLKVIALDSSKYIVWEQLLNIDGELENYESLEKISTTTIELFPNQPLPYLYKGISKTTLKKYDEAIDALKKGKEYAINNKLLLAEFYSRLGSVYNDTKDFTASEIAFDKCIELDSKNASALNNFSYYLSLRNDKLDKAAELAKKANNLSPNTPAYEDTYGWVLYKQKDYAEAKKWLEKAIEKSNNDPVIFEHYGDILYKLGETEKAYKYWLKAKEKGQGSEFLERKIKEKKLIEE